MKISLFSFCIVTTTILLTCSAVQAEDYLWKLDLNDHAEGPAPDLGNDLEVLMENGVKMLSKTKEGGVFFPKTILPWQETKDWNNIIFQVRYREEVPSGITLVVKMHGERSEADYLWYYVAIRKDKIEVICHGLEEDSGIEPEDPRLKSVSNYEDIGGSSLLTGEWITAEVQIGEEVLKVTVTTDDGGTRKAEFKTLPGTGGVNILAHQPLDVLSATVRAAEKEVTSDK